MRIIIKLLLAAMLAVSSSAFAIEPQDISVEDFVKHNEFSQVKISPTGRYLAVAAPDGEQTGIGILDISKFPKLSLAGSYKFSPFEHVSQIYWANDERVLFTTARQVGTLSQPQATGRLYAMDADGGNRLLVHGTKTGGMVGRGSQLLSVLPEAPNEILLATYAHDRTRPFVERIDITNGRSDIVATSPLDNGSIHIDNNRVARLAVSVDEDLNVRIAYRENEEADWTERELDWQEDIQVVGFTDDNQRILVQTNSADSMGLYEINPVTLKRKALLTNDTVEIDSLITEFDGEEIVGVVFEDGKPENHFIDENGRTAKLYRLLENAFPNTKVTVTSSTRDGKKAVLVVQNDRLPADYFMFDTEELKADYLLSARGWLDPNVMSEKQPISFTASDGMKIHGYLTIPRGAEPKNLPLVTIVHGGPHGPRDSWLFHYEVQLFASRGYAVLQVNYRGSGGYGIDFKEAGYRKWGTRIQDDVMDGVNWAIDQGIADPDRMCVYGGSFGGYSVAQQLVRYPDTWACGFAIVGVYDMELMFEEGDIPATERGQAFLRMVLGTDEKELRAHSPVHHVENIRSPLYVAHGKEDIRAHVEHYYQFIDALDEADIDHEEMLVEKEGHGFYKMENRIRYYNAVMDFIDEHIGD